MPKKPAAPIDIRPILDIHRGGSDAWIRFVSPDEGGKLAPLLSSTAADLEQTFPEFIDQLLVDAYFTLNSFYRGGTARTRDLRYLNVCFSDLDYYKAGTDRAAALATIVRATDAGLLLPASILADSGRGLWAFWLLESPTEPGRPEKAFTRHPEKLARYRRVQMALHKVLAKLEPALEPDPQAIDASRIAPVPGTFKTSSGRHVRYWVQKDADGRGYSYGLRELEKHFHLEIDQPVTAKQLRSWSTSGKRIPANRRGYVAMHTARLADLETLYEIRRGFEQGCRSFAVLIYATSLRGYRDEEGRKLSHDVIEQRCHEMASECRPPLEHAETEKQIRWSAEKHYRWSDDEIIERLRISGEELEQLSSIQAGRPKQRRPGPKDKPSHRKAARQALILRLVEDRYQGDKPSTRKMAAELKRAAEIDVSHATVAADYRDLALTAPQLEIEYSSPYLDLVASEDAVDELAFRLRYRFQDLEQAQIRGLAETALAATLELDLWRPWIEHEEAAGIDWQARGERYEMIETEPRPTRTPPPGRDVDRLAEIPRLLAGDDRAAILDTAEQIAIGGRPADGYGTALARGLVRKAFSVDRENGS